MNTTIKGARSFVKESIMKRILYIWIIGLLLLGCQKEIVMYEDEDSKSYQSCRKAQAINVVNSRENSPDVTKGDDSAIINKSDNIQH